MPQISFPDIKLKDIGDRLHDVRDEHLADELRERLSEAGERVSEAGARIGEEVGERVSDIRWSDLRLPNLNLAGALKDLSMPNVRGPKVDVPHFEMPKNLPKNLRKELAKLEIPQVTIGKPKSSGPPLVPFVVLAGVAGLFVGWWLATSEIASSRIRSMIDQVRARMGMASDWDEAVEERTEEFWGSERGWETPGEPDPDRTANRESSTTIEMTAPSSSISGDTGSLRDDREASMASSGMARAGATAAATSGWPDNPYGNPGGATGGTRADETDDSAGGTGYDPDNPR